MSAEFIFNFSQSVFYFKLFFNWNLAFIFIFYSTGLNCIDCIDISFAIMFFR